MIPDGRLPGKPRPEEYPLSFRHCGGDVEKLAAEFARLDAQERGRQLSYRVDGATAGRRGRRHRRRTTARPAAGTWTPEATEACLLAILRLLIARPELVLALLEILRRAGGKGAGR